MAQPRVIILAAGKGTRMKSDMPKVLHPLCGKAMIDYVLEVARSISSLTYVVLGHQSQSVQSHLGSQGNIVYQKKLLGTADAIKSVQPK
ncbi:MAG: NTP transferase domain-containing protein, partial [Candidatus Omnitrophota bacterium]